MTDPVTAVPDELRTPLFAFVAPRAVFVGAAVALPIVGLTGAALSTALTRRSTLFER